MGQPDTVWTGVLTREDIGAGVWVLTPVTGGRYQLLGHVPAKFEGELVSVWGTVAGSLLGIAMVGPIIRVSRIERATGSPSAGI